MNFKTKNSNLTKSLYIILILCIISVVCLSIYAFFSRNKNDDSSMLLDNGITGSDNHYLYNNNESEDLLRIFGTTEPATNRQNAPLETVTEPPSVIEQVPEEVPQVSTGNITVPEEKPLPVEPEKTVELQNLPEVPEADAEYHVESYGSDSADVIDIADVIETLAVPSFFMKPLAGSVSKIFSEDTLEYSIIMNDYRTHMGIDIESEIGANVKAIADGIISEVYFDPLMGKTVVISHAGGIESLYKNLLDMVPPNIIAGTMIKAGDVIGGVGNTSLIEESDVPHLHFAMRKENKLVDPLEYIEY